MQFIIHDETTGVEYIFPIGYMPDVTPRKGEELALCLDDETGVDCVVTKVKWSYGVDKNDDYALFIYVKHV